MQNFLLITLAVAAAIGAMLWFQSDEAERSDGEDERTVTEEVAIEADASISDPITTEPENINDAVSAGSVSGEVAAAYYQDRYSLRGTFANVPEPSTNEFYEGWITRKNPPERISTGNVPFENGQYVATYGSGRDLTEFDTFLLTREIKDGNPAPGETVFTVPIEILQNRHAF